MGIHDAPASTHAAFAAAIDRARPMTRAPFAARALIVSKPIPELQPVTTKYFLDRSTPAKTSSAVELEPKGIE
jgi:hypothetical protein